MSDTATQERMELLNRAAELCKRVAKEHGHDGSYCAEAADIGKRLAALDAPAKTRGQEVAEQTINKSRFNEGQLAFGGGPGGGRAILFEGGEFLLIEMRRIQKQIIDAERAAAKYEGAKEMHERFRAALQARSEPYANWEHSGLNQLCCSLAPKPEDYK